MDENTMMKCAITKILKRFDPIVLTAVVLGLVFRLLLWKACRFMISYDEANYLRLAGYAMQTDLSGILHPYWSPFYPLMVWCFSLFHQHPEIAGRWVNILAGTGIIPLIYIMGRKFFNVNSARLAALIVAFYPPFVFDSTSAMPESVYTLTALSGILLGWRALSRQRWQPGLAAGLCWGATYLAKPEGIGFLAVFIMFTLGWWLVHRHQFQILKAVSILLITGTGFFILAFPYFLYLKNATGVWTISTKGMLNQQMQASVVFNDGPVKDPLFHVTADNQHLPYDMGLHFGNFNELKSLSDGQERIVHLSLSKYAFKYSRNIYRLLKEAIPQLFGVILFVLLVAGFLSPEAASQPGFLIYLFLFVGFYWFGVVPLFHVNIRYLMPLLPLFFIWIGEGMRTLFHRLSHLAGMQCRTAKWWIGAGLGLIMTAGVLLPETGVILKQNQPSPDMWAQPLELKKAALWLKSTCEHPPVLMTLNKAIDFYAGQYNMKKGASFSYDSVEKNLAYARHRGCEYIVFTSRYLSWFENLKPLVADTDPPGLEKIYDSTDTRGIRAVIYRIKEPE